MMVNAGLATRSEIRMDRKGDDWRDVVEKLAQEQEIMDQAGIRIVQDAAGESVSMGGEAENIINPDSGESNDE